MHVIISNYFFKTTQSVLHNKTSIPINFYCENGCICYPNSNIIIPYTLRRPMQNVEYNFMEKSINRLSKCYFMTK